MYIKQHTENTQQTTRQHTAVLTQPSIDESQIELFCGEKQAGIKSFRDTGIYMAADKSKDYLITMSRSSLRATNLGRSSGEMFPIVTPKSRIRGLRISATFLSNSRRIGFHGGRQIEYCYKQFRNWKPLVIVISREHSSPRVRVNIMRVNTNKWANRQLPNFDCVDTGDQTIA